MSLLIKSGAAALVSAGMLYASAALAQSAGENAVQAAMDACEQEKEMEDARLHCQLHALAAHQSMQAANEGSEGTIHFDFDDSNDSDAQKAAKQEMYKALDDCEMSGDPAGQISQCRTEAFHQYQEAIGG